ncbi:MAG: TetR/AcrR family transcriptional regulator, partial [Dehalococcoidia bacterium]|nr:TetR/AcrR family transcriptional regulator [Dehalococcoidia bacterium]
MNQQRTIIEMDEPKRGSPEIRQTQIIEAAMRCFQRKGYENTTIDDITAEYGLSKGSIYWYYSSKKDILIAVFDHMISELFEGYKSQVLSDISPKQKLINILRLFVEMLLESHEACRPFIVLMGVAYE